MNAGGITRRLIAFAEAVVGAIRGGLAYVVVIVNMIMAGVSGAAIAWDRIKLFWKAASAKCAAPSSPLLPPSPGRGLRSILTECSVGRYRGRERDRSPASRCVAPRTFPLSVAACRSAGTMAGGARAATICRLPGRRRLRRRADEPGG